MTCPKVLQRIPNQRAKDESEGTSEVESIYTRSLLLDPKIFGGVTD